MGVPSPLPPCSGPCPAAQRLSCKREDHAAPGLAPVCEPKRSQKLWTGKQGGSFFQRGSLAPFWAKRREYVLNLIKIKCLLRLTRKHTLGSSVNKMWWACWFCFHYAFISHAHHIPHPPSEPCRNKHCPIAKMGKLVQGPLLYSKEKPDVRSYMLSIC